MAERRFSLRRGDRRGRRRRRPAAARAAVRGVVFLQLTANGFGALVILVYLRWLFPGELPSDGSALDAINETVFAIYLVVTVVLAVPVNRMILRQAVSWVREGREPTDLERKATLSLPLAETVSAFLGWLGAAVIFGLLNTDAARVSVGIALAGLVTCSMLYLLLERHFRPIFALALERTTLPENRRDVLPKIMLAWWLGSAVPLLALGVAPLTMPKEDLNFSWQLTLLVVTALAAGGLIMRAAAGSVAGPINRVRNAMGRVEEGDLDVFVPVDDIGELGRLAAGFNEMVEGMRERTELFELLDGQVGAEVVAHSLSEKPRLGGGRRDVTTLFVDLHGYTAYAEQHSPEEVVDLLNRFFAVVVGVIRDEGGYVNKFEGDAAMCIFGAPADQPDHASRALRAAARLPEALTAMPEAPSAGIGVATGTVVAGYVGTPDRYEYTVIGDVVNLAARLTDLAKERPGGALADDKTVEAAGGMAAVGESWADAGTVQVRGRRQATHVYAPVTKNAQIA